MDNPPIIAITLGDPAGVGPEIIVKTLRHPLEFCRPLVVGDAAWLRRTAERFAPEVAIHPVQDVAEARFLPGTLDVLDLRNVPADLSLGRPCADGGRAAVEAIQKAVTLALNHQVHAITTAPINKEGMHLAGFHYPGHTELLADLTRADHVALMLAGGGLRVVLTTTHIALQDVKAMLTPQRVANTIRLTHHWLTQEGLARPKIAVTGLNPHCGDGGIFGDEEAHIIAPSVEQTRTEGIAASGPFPADALFGRIRQEPWDAVVTMYHDQGMIPIKMAAMGHAVNITLGLPIIRTSVDHGTAYDIAGKGVASAESLIAALQVAARRTRSTPVIQ